MGIMAEWYVGNNSDKTMIPAKGKVWDEGSRKGLCQDGAAGTESASSVSLGPPSWESGNSSLGRESGPKVRELWGTEGRLGGPWALTLGTLEDWLFGGGGGGGRQVDRVGGTKPR